MTKIGRNNNQSHCSFEEVLQDHILSVCWLGLDKFRFYHHCLFLNILFFLHGVKECIPSQSYPNHSFISKCVFIRTAALFQLLIPRKQEGCFKQMGFDVLKSHDTAMYTICLCICLRQYMYAVRKMDK